ncbi:MAG: LON peptidase substrate-binding domain-containing protein [Fimbriimonadales bacterium]|nr:LON peptidase substrate-binding domain-containing protein [Fimbriimonadales bacterium]
MAGAFERMPLFLLDTVLFPYAALQLRVFEDRYLRMVRECLETGTAFGVALIRSGPEVGGPAEPFLVGTRVRILQVYPQPDGQLEVHVIGERRFRIRRFDEQAPYPVGFVEPVDDDEEWTPRLHALTERARELCMDYIRALFREQEAEVRVALPRDASQLGFAIAGLLQLENAEKQLLLECTDPAERLRTMIPILERECESVQDQRRLHRLSARELSGWIQPN